MDTLLKEINPVLPPGRNHCIAHLSGATLPLGLSCTTANWTFFALTRLLQNALYDKPFPNRNDSPQARPPLPHGRGSVT
jgi:hypothetical protein